MNRIFSLLTVVLLNITTTCFAQHDNGSIRGTVEDGNSRILEAANVSLLKAKDSAVIKQMATDKKGKFGFENMLQGRYLVTVSAVGYKTTYSDIIIVTREYAAIDLKTIALNTEVHALSAVTVTSKRPLYEQKAGKMVINVEASPTNTGLNALELLEKAPGVSVDNDGNISVKGKQGVLILIDGKPTYMSATDLAAYLKTIQSTSLDQIEVMTNPPAKYDASGNSGIINIKTKKGALKGMNGTANINYSQGVYGGVNGGVNLNYRNNKLNVFGGMNAGNYEGFNKLNIDRKFLEPDNQTISGSANQITRNGYMGTYESGKFGLDYYFTKKDIAGFVVNGNFNDHHQNQNGNSYVKDAFENVQYRLGSTSNNKRLATNISTNFNYKHSFDSTGRELTADVDYVYYNNKSNNQLNTQSYNASDIKNGNTIILKGNMPSVINIYSAKTDYVHPFKKGLKLEAGLKTSFVHNDSQVSYDRNSGNEWTPDSRSNHFLYDENINAAYSILSKSIKKWELVAGLRLENTISKGHQLTNDSTFKRNYTNLFPNVGVGFNANKRNQFNLSYSRRVMRPDYESLNPFVFFIDSLTYSIGNPYLQPQFTNNIEVSHTYNRFLTTTFNYTRTTDIITQLLKQDTEKKATYQTTENLSSMNQLGLSVTANIPVQKWWSINVYTDVYHNHYKGIYQNDPIDLRFTGFTGNISNSFVLGKGWNGEISGWYRTRGPEGLLVINSMGAVNTGLSKQAFKTKGTFKLGLRDVLNTQQFSGYAKYSNVDVQLAGRRDSRQVNLSFNYRFGKKDIPAARRKTGGSDDEQNRVKSGNN
jgi:iron complex outermembrane receptor protein